MAAADAGSADGARPLADRAKPLHVVEVEAVHNAPGDSVQAEGLQVPLMEVTAGCASAGRHALLQAVDQPAPPLPNTSSRATWLIATTAGCVRRRWVVMA